MQRTPLAHALGLILGFTAAPSPAQTAEPALLQEIVVTATRTARTADASLAAVTVITRRDLDRSQAQSLDEVLRSVPDIDLSRNGGPGKSATVHLRGTNAGHVLVLVDGVRAGSATLGAYAWPNLLPEQIERIEIVRGPRAALYGSDAIGGVIQIFTRKVSAPFVQIGAGTRATRSADAGLGGKLDENWSYSLTAGNYRTRGIPTNVSFTTRHLYENSHFTGGLAGIITPDLRLHLDFSRSEGQSELDPGTGDEEFRNQVSSARLAHQVAPVRSQRLTLGHAVDRLTSRSPTTPATITTRRTSLAWQHDLNLIGNALTSVGLDSWRDAAAKDQSGRIDKALDTSALFLQHQFQVLGADWILGARSDRHENFGRKTTGNLAWGLDLTPATRLTASIGTAFKAPTVNDLYWPNSASTFAGTTYITEGNPNLRPESSQSEEIGLRHTLRPGLTLTANAYHTRISELIEWQSTQTGPAQYTYRPANVSRALIHGLDLGAAGQLDGWKYDATLGWMTAENANTGVQLDRRPQRRFAVKLGRDFGPDALQAEWTGASMRLDRTGTTQLRGYGLLNLTWSRALNRDTRLQARVENVFDRDYVLASSFSGDYNTLGRTLFVSLRYQPAR